MPESLHESARRCVMVNEALRSAAVALRAETSPPVSLGSERDDTNDREGADDAATTD